MKKTIARRQIAALLLLICPFISTAAGAGSMPKNYTSRTKVLSGAFATVSRLCIFDDFSSEEANRKFEATWQEVKDILASVEEDVSVSVPTSDVARFNALRCGEATGVTDRTASLVETARRMNEITKGYYDPTVAPLVDLWGFSPRFTYTPDPVYPYDRERIGGTLPPPDERYIDQFLKLVGMDGVVLEGDGDGGYFLRKMTPGVTVDGSTYDSQLNLGGIAKGYAVDLVTELLAGKGYEYGFFSCGSSSMRLMKSASRSAIARDDDRYELDVRKPRATLTPGNAYARVKVREQSLSSSGDYDDNYPLNGDIYSHTVSPFTGYPVNTPSGGVQSGISTVTLLSGSATEDDAYTTALMLMGPEGALAYINEHLRQRDFTMVWFKADQETYEVVTNIPEPDLVILDDAYVPASEIGDDGTVRYTGRMFDFKIDARGD